MAWLWLTVGFAKPVPVRRAVTGGLCVSFVFEDLSCLLGDQVLMMKSIGLKEPLFDFSAEHAVSPTMRSRRAVNSV